MLEKIGMGYSSNKQSATGAFCVDSNSIKLHSNSVSKLSMRALIDHREVQEELGFSFAIGVNTGSFGFGLSMYYAQGMKDNDYLLSYSFMYNVEFATEILEVQKYGEGSLNNFGRIVYNQGIEEFNEVCGDQFVTQARKGAQLFVTLSIRFRSKQDKDSFGGSIAVGFESIFNVALKYMSDSNNALLTSNVEISALQIGGDAIRLSKILGDKSDPLILDCNLKSKAGIENCRNIINQVMKYTENDLVNQYNYAGKSSIAKGYIYSDYTTIGINSEKELKAKEIKIYLSKLYEKMYKIKAIAENIVEYGGITGKIKQHVEESVWDGTWSWDPKLLNIETLNQINYAKEIAEHIIYMLKSEETGALVCYQKAYRCEEIYKTIQKAIECQDIGREYKFVKQIGDVGLLVEKTAPFDIIDKVYIANVDCSISKTSISNKYTGRMLIPIGKDRYYEDSKFKKISNDNETAVTKNFYNMYKLELNADRSKMESFKVSNIEQKIAKYSECGEFYINNPDSLVPYFKGRISKHSESEQCIKAICAYSEEELNQVSSIQIELYEYDSPL